MSWLRSQEWTVPGTYTWIVPQLVTCCWVTILGAGGGGHTSFPGNNKGGVGGGAGEQVCNMIYRSSPGASITVVVGAAGIGWHWVNKNNVNLGLIQGTAGGDSSFGTYKALGGGNFETGGFPQQISTYGGGVNGGLQGNDVTRLFSDTFGQADASLWFGGSGGGSDTDINISGNIDAMDGGPAGGRLQGGKGGRFGLAGYGPGGGGGATLYGPGGDGGAALTDGTSSQSPGAGGGGAGGCQGTGPNFGPQANGGDGAPGYVCVSWLQP